MTYAEKWIDEDELLDYLSDKGAATIKEIKTTFNTNSRMTRLSLFQLGLTLEDDDSTEDYTLLVSGGKGLTTWWFLWPKHKRGKPNPSGLRKDAEARHNSVKARHRERTEKEVPALREKRKKNTIVDIT